MRRAEQKQNRTEQNRTEQKQSREDETQRHRERREKQRKKKRRGTGWASEALGKGRPDGHGMPCPYTKDSILFLSFAEDAH